MKRFIITKKQLSEFVEKKRAERVFYKIVEDLYRNKKFISENTIRSNANQTVIENYRRKNLITPRVFEMLIKYKIINEKHEIL